MNPEAELRNQNERLELLLNLTASITSSLDLREVLRAIAANIREVMQADAVAVSLPDTASGKVRVFAGGFSGWQGGSQGRVAQWETSQLRFSRNCCARYKSANLNG
jgi:hypothetical protein